MPISRHNDVHEALTCPARFAVPAAREDASLPCVVWLRAHVVRFCDDAVHVRRRARVESILAELRPEELRARAQDRTAAVAPLPGAEPSGLLSHAARTVPVSVLAAELGFVGDVTGSVHAVSGAYHPHTEPDEHADAAVAQLVRAGGGVADASTALRIGLLVQAAEATAALIEATARRWEAWCATDSPEAFLTEVLRHDPPVRVTRRVVPARGDTVVELDLGAANRDPDVFGEPDRFRPGRPNAERHLSFGAGPHHCPGEAQARALATGVLTALGRARKRDTDGRSRSD